MLDLARVKLVSHFQKAGNWAFYDLETNQRFQKFNCDFLP